MNKKIFLIAVLVLALAVAACQPVVDEENESFNYSELITTPNKSNETGDDSFVKVDDKIDVSKASFKVAGVEGDLIRIPITAVDPDGDFLEYTFDDPFNDQGLWLTQIGDEGQYLVKVSVSDGLLSTSEFVLVTVNRANRPPTIECPETITVQETETISINCNIFDEDGDPVIVGYEGWMRSSTYETKYGDAGEYSVVVRARDQGGESIATVKVIVTKKNRAPVLEDLADVEVMETNTLRIVPVVSDPDGDAVKVTFSSPLSANGTWTPDFGDRGVYTVTVTASDGQADVSKEFEITVLRRNRAPVMKDIGDIYVKEGDKVTLGVQAYDPDGDDITISYSGWMTSDTYTTTYDDAEPKGCNEKGCTAEYEVTITVSDGILDTVQTVKIFVEDKNRPPQFLWN